jgi:putative spermidine/putrescine transport system ATP-binding protein
MRKRHIVCIVSTTMTAAPSEKQSLNLEQISHRYGASLVVDGVDLSIEGGELVSLLGPSGCGKTTLLKIVAGFARQEAGRVLVGGTPIDHLPANRRRVGIVFQNYALFPHMNVASNIAYGLDVMGLPRAEKRARVAEMLALVRMDGMADRTPRQLSGGQQQRGAKAPPRAPRPALQRRDEPFAALDKSLRLDMQIEVKRIQRMAGTTTILVTHDQEEALSLSDRVAVLNRGRIEQFAPPSEIYDHPASLFVNTFVGSANVLDGVVVGPAGNAPDLFDVTVEHGAVFTARSPHALAAGTRVALCIRPEALVASESAGLAATVSLGLPMGSVIVHELRTAAGLTLKMASTRRIGEEPLPSGVRLHLATRDPAIAHPVS